MLLFTKMGITKFQKIYSLYGTKLVSFISFSLRWNRCTRGKLVAPPIDNIKTFEKHFLLLSDTTRTDNMILLRRAEQKYPNVCRYFILQLTNILRPLFRSAHSSISFLKKSQETRTGRNWSWLDWIKKLLNFAGTLSHGPEFKQPALRKTHVDLPLETFTRFDRVPPRNSHVGESKLAWLN